MYLLSIGDSNYDRSTSQGLSHGEEVENYIACDFGWFTDRTTRICQVTQSKKKAPGIKPGAFFLCLVNYSLSTAATRARSETAT